MSDGASDRGDGHSLWEVPELPRVTLEAPPSSGSDLIGDEPMLVVALVSDEPPSDELNGALNGELKALIDDSAFDAKKANSSAAVRHRRSDGQLRVLAVYTLGSRDALSARTLYKLGAHANSLSKQSKTLTRARVLLPSRLDDRMVRACVEGAMIGSYTDRRFRQVREEDKQLRLATVTVVSDNRSVNAEEQTVIVRSVLFARQLVNAPPNVLSPDSLAACVRAMSERLDLECEVLDRAECERRGMGLYLAVAQGATSEPRFIHVTYRSTDSPTVRVAFVGKGITFDSGGYNLKVGADSMINIMKMDMGGAAAVFGAAHALAQLRPPHVEVHFISAACENLINGHAYRPGDVVKASNGKTVEVVNTDAEGRMTLADALVFADGLGVDYIMDVATLTGSMIGALGHEYAGFFSNSDDFRKDISDAAHVGIENAWPMPMSSEYRELLESSIADIKQLNTLAGDCVNAAIFLKEFVAKAKHWAHWDIAGVAWSPNAGGATGFGVRTLVRLAQALASSSSSSSRSTKTT